MTSDVMSAEGEWLRTMLVAELDLRPARSIGKEAYGLTGDDAITIRDKDARLIGYGRMTRCGKYLELTTVVIDPDRRGKGHSHQLIAQAIKLTPNGLPLHCWTKSPALTKSLIAAGFVRKKSPSLRYLPNIIFLTSIRIFSLIIRLQFRRSSHQIRHLPHYKLHVLQQPL
jgi:GNAT superfamily N-acetyltransferase